MNRNHFLYRNLVEVVHFWRLAERNPLLPSFIVYMWLRRGEKGPIRKGWQHFHPGTLEQRCVVILRRMKVYLSSIKGQSQAALAPLLAHTLGKLVFEPGASEIWNVFSSQMLKGPR